MQQSRMRDDTGKLNASSLSIAMAIGTHSCFYQERLRRRYLFYN